jgi:Transposase IS116/IS110/IS902 family
VERLATIPGVGRVLSLTWVLEIGEISRFSSVKDAGSYCGLCGAEKNSEARRSGPRSPSSGTSIYKACSSKQRNRSWIRNDTVAARLTDLKPVAETRLNGAKKIRQVVEDEVTTSLRRVLSLAIRRRKMLDVIEARAKQPENQWAPGGNTGMVITSERTLGKFGGVLSSTTCDIFAAAGVLSSTTCAVFQLPL